MATEDEITNLWASFPKELKHEEMAIRLYRLAESDGKKTGILALEKELLSDATVEAALKTFGWGRGHRASVIATRAILRESIRIAVDKVGK